MVILIVGEKTTDNDNLGNTGGEGRDRATIGLPGEQQQVVDAVVAMGKPTVVIVISGGSVTVENVVGNPKIALVYAGFGGEAGATALVNVLTGKHNPSGRLAWTVYPMAWEKVRLFVCVCAVVFDCCGRVVLKHPSIVSLAILLSRWCH